MSQMFGFSNLNRTLNPALSIIAHSLDCHNSFILVNIAVCNGMDDTHRGLMFALKMTPVARAWCDTNNYNICVLVRR